MNGSLVSTKITRRTSTRGRNVAKNTSTAAPESAMAFVSRHHSDTQDAGMHPPESHELAFVVAAATAAGRQAQGSRRSSGVAVRVVAMVRFCLCGLLSQ